MGQLSSFPTFQHKQGDFLSCIALLISNSLRVGARVTHQLQAHAKARSCRQEQGAYEEECCRSGSSCVLLFAVMESTLTASETEC